MKPFEWDAGNSLKVQKHGVSIEEIESAFADEHIVIINDEKHSIYEERYNAVAKSKFDNYLYLTFTIRNEKIRIISARKTHEKERKKLGYSSK